MEIEEQVAFCRAAGRFSVPLGVDREDEKPESRKGAKGESEDEEDARKDGRGKADDQQPSIRSLRSAARGGDGRPGAIPLDTVLIDLLCNVIYVLGAAVQSQLLVDRVGRRWPLGGACAASSRLRITHRHRRSSADA